MIADILLVAGALGAGFYCYILSRRLNRFNDLEKGVGGAVAVLSAQVDDLNASLTAAKSVSEGSNVALEDLTTRAESVAQKLELMMASMHDLSDPSDEPAAHSDVVAAAQPAPKPAPVPDPDPEPLAKRAANGPIFVRHDRSQGAS